MKNKSNFKLRFLNSVTFGFGFGNLVTVNFGFGSASVNLPLVDLYFLHRLAYEGKSSPF